MSAYVRALNRELEAVEKLPAPAPLKARLEAWLSSLPTVSRNRPFAMSEFEQALGTQGKYISPILIRLGWVRKRIWSTDGQYHRFWTKKF